MFKKEISLNLRSKQPLADQLRDQILRLIENGTIQPGQQLPTVRQAALYLDINFNTVARAYRSLDETGIITTRQGRGTYVIDRQKSDQENNEKSEVLDILLNKLLAETERNHISPDKLLLALQRKIQSVSAKMNTRRRKRRPLSAYKPGYPIHLKDIVPQKGNFGKSISSPFRKKNQTSRHR